MKRLYHSVWTKPMFTPRWGVSNQLDGNLWYFALSVHYANAIGAEIVLHTDKLGAETFGKLPYAEVHQTLEPLNQQNEHPRFWAMGKMLAHRAEGLGAVHIDGDVFIKTTECLEELAREGYDLVVQNLERTGEDYIYIPHRQEIMPVLTKNPSLLPIEFDEAQKFGLCTGVVGFFDETIKQQYIDGYFKMLAICKTSPELFGVLDDYSTDLCPDLILEQWWLKCVTDQYNAKINYMFDLERDEDVYQRAIDIGYTHIIGYEKYAMLDQVKVRLKEVNPGLYELVEGIVKTVKNFEEDTHG